jgi:hypothetical protein
MVHKVKNDSDSEIEELMKTRREKEMDIENFWWSLGFDEEEIDSKLRNASNKQIDWYYERVEEEKEKTRSEKED